MLAEFVASFRLASPEGFSPGYPVFTQHFQISTQGRLSARKPDKTDLASS